MVIFDTVTCDYPLPDARHQDLEFQTKDLEKVLGHYTITGDGRLIRPAQPSPFVPAPVSDVEWPIHGDISIYERDPDWATASSSTPSGSRTGASTGSGECGWKVRHPARRRRSHPKVGRCA